MIEWQELGVLPEEFQRLWQARLHKAEPTELGVFRLVGIRATEPHSFEEGRIVVSVVDENGFPLSQVRVAFAYSTADPYTLSQDFLWTPPGPQRAFMARTQGSGQIDQIQGSAVKKGESGGITVYILEPKYASDYVSGAGMLVDHTGMHLTFQLWRAGVRPLGERLREIEARLEAVEKVMWG